MPAHRSPATAEVRSLDSGKGDHGYQEGKIVPLCIHGPMCLLQPQLAGAFCLLQMEPLHDRILIKPIEEEPVSVKDGKVSMMCLSGSLSPSTLS